MAKLISSFSNNYRFLSNFFNSPIVVDSKLYPTVEHYYQASKTLTESAHEAIRNAKSPGEAKRMGGRTVLRPDWENIKHEVMWKGLWAKFTQNPNLKVLLKLTGDARLVEGNYWHDNIWGSCSCPKCASTEGQNILGKMLMEIRKTP